MKSLEQYTILKLALIVIFAMHSIPSIYSGDVNGFGKMYLDTKGFAPFGIYLAWMIKLSHLGLIISILTDRFLKIMGWVNIAVLVTGIIMVHWPDGWFVVGGGRNGIEFNILLIACLLTLMYKDIKIFNSKA